MSTATASFPGRLYVKGLVQAFKGSKVNQDSHTSILRIQGVSDAKATEFYFGKRVAYIFKAKTLKNGSKFRVIWGRITRAHGTTGAVRAKFAVNLPPRALGGSVRVMLYPSRV